MCVLQFVLSKYMMSVVRSPFPVSMCGRRARASVAEVAMSWLLEVEKVMLDSLANTVLALDGVTSHVVSVRPGPSLLNAG